MKIDKNKILKIKDPKEYINFLIKHKNKFSLGEKIILSREWRAMTGYTVDDIKYARHRHPYWKKIKQQGYKERNEIRFKKHFYKLDKKTRTHYSKEDFELFFKLNKKVMGEYIMTDWQIAKEIKRSIPSVQYLRRKANIIEKIEKVAEGVSKEIKIMLMFKSESNLSSLLDEYTKNK